MTARDAGGTAAGRRQSHRCVRGGKRTFRPTAGRYPRLWRRRGSGERAPRRVRRGRGRNDPPEQTRIGRSEWNHSAASPDARRAPERAAPWAKLRLRQPVHPPWRRALPRQRETGFSVCLPFFTPWNKPGRVRRLPADPHDHVCHAPGVGVRVGNGVAIGMGVDVVVGRRGGGAKEKIRPAIILITTSKLMTQNIRCAREDLVLATVTSLNRL